jgi:uncharacterized repeat protein (TIGR03803 family)
LGQELWIGDAAAKGRDGFTPYAGLIFDAAGNLYGTTYGGGTYGGGTVFEVSPGASDQWSEKVLYSFGSGKDGVTPQGGLIFDGKGNLYGTTSFGGAFGGYGTVFELSPSNGQWTESVLHAFNQKDGAWPWYARLSFDTAGNLYGTTSSGGNQDCNGGNNSGCGEVFQLVPSNGQWTESVLHFFSSGNDGAYPYAGLVFDQAGNLYGTTTEGGNPKCLGGNGCGTVFRLRLSNGQWAETVLHAFFAKAGDGPAASVIFDTAGNLYGTTSGGGAFGFGNVFEVTP